MRFLAFAVAFALPVTAAMLLLRGAMRPGTGVWLMATTFFSSP